MTSPAGSPSSASHPSAKVNGPKSGRSTPKTAMSKIVELPEPANIAHLEARISDLADSDADLAMRRIHHDTAQRNYDKQMEERSRWDKYRENKNYVALNEDLTRRAQKTEQARDHTAKLLSQSEERNVNAVKSLASILSAACNRASSQKPAEESALKPKQGQSVDVKENESTVKKLIEKMQAAYDSQQQQIVQLKASTISEASLKNFDTRLSALSYRPTDSEALSARFDRCESTISGLQVSVNDSKILEKELKQNLLARNVELQHQCDIQQNLLEERGQDTRFWKEQAESAIASFTEIKKRLDEAYEKHESSIGSLHQASVNTQSHTDQLQQRWQDLSSSVSSIEREVNGPSSQVGDNGIIGFVQGLKNENTSLLKTLEQRDTQIDVLSNSLESLRSRLSTLEEQLHSQSLINQVMSPSIPSSPRFWQRQDTPPVSLSSRMKQSPDVPDLSTPQSINERFECVFKEISGMKENESNRDEVVSAAVESVQNDSAKQQAIIDRLSTDVSALKAKNGELRMEIEKERETKKSLESLNDAQATTLEAIRSDLLSLGAFRPTLLELQSKVSQDGTRLEAKLRDFTASVDDRVGPLEDFSTKMEARYDNLTTDYLARNIIHQMQQMYPPHPGNIYQEITWLKEKQERQAHQIHHAFIMGQHASDESKKALELRKTVLDLQQKVDMPPPIPSDSRAVKDSEENRNRNSVAIEVCRSQYQEIKRQVDSLTSDQAPVRSLTDRVEAISRNLEQLNPKEYQGKLETISQEVNGSLNQVGVELSQQNAECLAHRDKIQASMDAMQSKVTNPASLEKDFKQLSQTVDWNHRNLVTEISRVESENRALVTRVTRLEEGATQGAKRGSNFGNLSRSDEIDEDSDTPIKILKRSQPSSQTTEERRKTKKRRYEDDEDHSEGSDIALRHTRQSARTKNHDVTNSPSTRSKGGLRAPSTDKTLIDGRS